MTHRDAERGLGDIGQRVGDARDRPDAADIGERDQKRRFRLHAAQNAHHLGRANAPPRRRLRVVGKKRGERASGIAVEQAQEARGVRLNEVPEIRRRFGNAAQKLCQRRMRADERLERLGRRLSP